MALVKKAIEEQGFVGFKLYNQMMAQYRFLYTDVSHHHVMSYRSRRLFREDYANMRQDWVADWSQIKKKILFGIDWHTIKRVKGFRDFQQRYVEVLSHDGLFSRSEIEDFLGGNALRFLGLLPNDQNRRRLETFYQNQNISPPDWFTSTAGQETSGVQAQSLTAVRGEAVDDGKGTKALAGNC